jgi:hypothetical protein
MVRPEPGQQVEIGLKVGDEVRLIEVLFLDLIVDNSGALEGYLIQQEIKGNPEEGEDPEQIVALGTTLFNATEVVSLTWTNDVEVDA